MLPAFVPVNLLDVRAPLIIRSYLISKFQHSPSRSKPSTSYATISVTLLTHCRYNCVSLPLPLGNVGKRFNQIDEDKRSQHYATLNRGRRGGCFNDLRHWLYMIEKNHISLKLINMKLRDISKRRLKSIHTLKPILPALSLQISSLSMHGFPL